MERFISDAIISCLNQRYEAREIIIIDDGSRDETSSVVSKFGRLVTYQYQQNSGVSSARNRGIEVSRGDYVAFLDADDIWLPEKLERQVVAIRNDSAIKAISCGYSIMDEEGKLIMPGLVRANYKNKEALNRVLSICQLIPGSASGLLVERECLSAAGKFDERFFIGEDWDLWLRIAGSQKIHFIEEVLVILRARRKKEATRSFDKELEQVKRVISKSVNANYKNRAYAALYARLGSAYLSANNYELAMKYTFESLKKRLLPIFPIDIRNRYKYPKYLRLYLLLKAFIKKHLSPIADNS
jgi:glycosyltransferase involved in cell wall biosynthesis